MSSSDDSIAVPGRNGHDASNTASSDIARVEKQLGADMRAFIKAVGDDPDREGLVDTPARYVAALRFFTRGYGLDPRAVVNDAIFSAEKGERGSGRLVVVKDIDIYSLCEHHLVPFFGKMHVGYMPSESIIGLSKIARIAEVFARRLQVQERLTRQVAEAIDDILAPEGVVVVVKATHLCMGMRGVEKTASTTTTSAAIGCFNNADYSEFWNLLRLND